MLKFLSGLENPLDGGAWWAIVHGVTKSRMRLSYFTFTFHFHALEKEMATHSSVLAWRIPGIGEPGGLLSMGSHRVGHDWSDLAAAAELNFVDCISVLVAQSCLTLCDPMDCSPPGLFVHEILQARILEWVAVSFSRLLYMVVYFCVFIFLHVDFQFSQYCLLKSLSFPTVFSWHRCQRSIDHLRVDLFLRSTFLKALP